ncbi:hypothetical protein MUCCIDRAFT_112706 [Mucor lusitanicus CBS 277.49]|uniref:Uncharacterized protein n=1 Tax=Mucor lusitanicus CBS 277.49 TaxID=747725 RepID=A0A162QE51_MUCCL|nr:hypothetical protein MUCCIDRAFT_112706 [Mucor lusitanicus CBS 277.49]
MSLTELTNELTKSFDACLETILADPQQKEDDAESLDTQLAALKSSFLQIENQLRDIRLKALGSKELSVTESNKLLKRDIEIKKSTIAKYVTKIENWEKELPVLKENSEKAVALRTDGHDFDSDIVLPEESTTATEAASASANNENADEDDEDEDVEFEEV